MSDRTRWDDLSLTRRLGLALATVGAVAVVLLVTFTVSAIRVNDRTDFVTGRSFDVVFDSATRFQGLVDQETGLRGYALTGNEEFLGPYESGVVAEQAAAERNRARLVGDAEVADLQQRLDAAVEAWRTEWAEPTLASVRADGAGALGEAELRQGKTLFDEVRAAHDDFDDVILAERAAALEEADAAERLLAAILIAAGVIALVFAVVLTIALRRWVTRPLAELGAEARTVREGRLDHVVRVDGPPELRALGHDIDAMRIGLVQQLHEVETARQQIEAARAELEEQAAELARSNRDLEQFAYVASHDLQEPLRKVASFCQMLQRRYEGQLDERADQYIAYAVDGAKRMQKLINDLLAFSRVGRATGDLVEVDLQDCLDQAVRNLELRIAEDGATVTSDPLPTVRGERALLTTLLQNLVANSLKFRSAAAPEVHVGVQRRDDASTEVWEFSCADNGIGVQPQYAERIFVIFQRLHAREDYEGTGIGLAMCKKIVEFHGGHIWLDTAVSSGTVIRWTLPVLAPAADDPPGDAPLTRHRADDEEIAHV